MRRYPTKTGQASAQTSFSLTPGHHDPSSDFSATLDPFPVNRAKGLRLQIGGVGADISDNDQCDFKVWLVRYVYDTAGTVISAHLSLYGFGTATFSGAKYLAGVTAAATGRMADTLTFTVAQEGSGTHRGVGTKLETALGSPGAQTYNHPTADIEAAEVLIPKLGDADAVIVEFDQTTGSPDGMFALLGDI